MNEDIRVSLDFWDHHKTVRLKMKLGYEGIEALQRLWFYTAKFRPDGHLTNMDDIDISIACKWKGEVKDLMETLTDKKYPWLDWRDDHYHLHNWEKRNGYAIHAEARAEKARRAANTRWEKRNKGKEKQQGNAKCITDHDAKNASSNAPSPAPNPAPIPSPSPNPNTVKEGNVSSLGKQCEGSSKKTKPKRAKTQEEILSPDQLVRFNRFWKIYPLKLSKEKAKIAWKKVDPDDELTELMVHQVEKAKNSNQWQKNSGEFIPYASSWLNSKRWEDEITTAEDLKRAQEEEERRLVEESCRRVGEVCP